MPRSPLTQGRGLKYELARKLISGETSPLTQGRGLKYELARKLISGEVAPYAGAWIEIICVCYLMDLVGSPLTQGRGLKWRGS